MLFRTPRLLFALISACWLIGCERVPPDTDAQPVRVFAAASLIDAMGEIAELWEEQGNVAPVFNFAATSQLAMQVRQGADVDVFVSADEAWMDEVEAAGFVVGETRHVIAGNSLVVVATRESEPVDPEREVTEALLQLEEGGRLVLAELSVPAGRYAKEALEATGLWPSIEAHVVYASDVRAALRLVEIGEAAAGVVYKTDALAAGGRVSILAEFPSGGHTAIVYPAAAIVGGDGEAFVEFLRSDAAQSRFIALGFRGD